MRRRWTYLGLYSGPGRARVEGTGEIVETTALSALRPRYPFTKYIFVDNDPRCIEALRGRIAALPGSHDVTYIQREVSHASTEIIEAMPRYGPGPTSGGTSRIRTIRGSRLSSMTPTGEMNGGLRGFGIATSCASCSGSSTPP